MDLTCIKCREPWDAYHLRHDTSWTDDYTGKLEIEPADNGEVPEQVEADITAGEPGWLRFVATGKGCPSCYGRPDLQLTREHPLSFAELMDIDTATEGQLLEWM